MFGAFRLALAVLVVISHAQVHLFRLNVGVIAVTNFYIVSGFAMSAVLRRHYLDDAGAFYLDRAVRILPQYALYLMLAVFAVFVLGINPAARTMTAEGLIANLTIVPLSWAMFSPAIASGALLPQAWSLGTEVIFYLLAPVLIVSYRWALYAAMGVLCVAALGIISPDVYCYRLLPGSLVFFGIGILMQQGRYRAMWVLYVGIAFAGGAAYLNGTILQHLLREILIGALVGTPIILMLSTRRQTWWDLELGSASYGAFLSHSLVLWSFQYLHLYDEASRVEKLTAGIGAAVISIVLGWTTHQIVEKPFSTWRRRVRQVSYKNWLPERVWITVQHTEATPADIASSR